ncbi:MULTISPECIES: amino acid permease [Providencia]|uniref:amino acid permease n=1 Tax=Providencia TaxID=586 RepID=UPI001CFA325B|nr:MULTISPECIES: amino acid permease [Providencia]MCB4815303.1 amino acid permease [Providencia rettgeri]MCJ2221688.1 amino acid permease [Providencia rettgeri]MCJ2287552.1 amino acid permease [Providencia rettgeri]MCK8632241.1 amino acid permease [Providencia rettgeri]MCL0013593.1 amino acid permease [Providencia rettgeri]
MAIGSGIVFMPVQIGIKGIWVFIAATMFSYPAIYWLQNLYLRTLSESEECNDYASVITQYLGKNWGIALGIAYFLMLLHGMFSYSLAVTFDSASYIKTFGLTEGLLSDSVWYGLIIISVLVAIAAQGERLLFKVSGPMVIVKFGIIVLLGIVMVPYWNFANITAFPDFLPFMRDVFLTLPFTLFSILFVQILSPMNIAYRKIESDKRIATYRAIRANRVAYIILAVAVLFFAFSFTFSISHEQAVSAFEQNISALAIAAQVIPGAVVKVMTALLNIFAILTAFLGIYLGFQEAIKGIVVNLLSRFIPEERINQTVLHYGVCLGVIIALWFWVSTRFSILFFMQLGGPLFGIVSCLIPCYLVYKVPALHKFKGPTVWFIIFFGVLLCLSPFFKFFE